MFCSVVACISVLPRKVRELELLTFDSVLPRKVRELKLLTVEPGLPRAVRELKLLMFELLFNACGEFCVISDDWKWCGVVTDVVVAADVERRGVGS